MWLTAQLISEELLNIKHHQTWRDGAKRSSISHCSGYTRGWWPDLSLCLLLLLQSDRHTVSALTDTFQCKHSFPPTSRICFYWSNQISSQFQWVDVMDDSVWVLSSHDIIQIIHHIQYACFSHENTIYQTSLFIAEIMHTVFVYTKCEACRTGTAGRQRPSRNLHEHKTKKKWIHKVQWTKTPSKHFFCSAVFISFCHWGTIPVNLDTTNHK